MYYMFLPTGLTTEEIQQCFWRGTHFISLLLRYMLTMNKSRVESCIYTIACKNPGINIIFYENGITIEHLAS